MLSVRKEIKDLAAEIDKKDGLSVMYQYREGYHIVNQMIKQDIEIRKNMTLVKFENLITYYNELRYIAENEYDTFMNNTLWNKIIQPLTNTWVFPI